MNILTMKYYNRIRIITDKTKYTYETDVFASESLNDNYALGAIMPTEKVKFNVASQSKPIPDILGRHYLPMVSNKFKLILERLNDADNFQFMNAIPNKKNVQEYWALNLLKPIECFDMKNSIFDYFRNGISIRGIEKLQMHVSNIGDRNLFRMKEFPMLIFVSPLLEKLMAENELTGYRIGSTDNPTED